MLKTEDALFLASRCSPIYVEAATEMADKGFPSSSIFSVPGTALSTVYINSYQFSSVAQSCPTLCDPMNSRSVMSDSLRPHESQHARPPCPSPTPGVHSNTYPLSQ